MRLIPLGTNGFFPSYGRQTACYLVRDGADGFLFDAGTGVSRLIEPGISAHLDGSERLSIFLSHYHLDHCAGLAYLTEVWPHEVTIYAPAAPFTKATPEEALGTLLDAPFAAPLSMHPAPVNIVPVTTETMAIAGRDFTFRAQRHWRGSMGIRMADDLTYVTDTVIDDATVALTRGVRTLFHEVWMLDSEVEGNEIGTANHSYVTGVAEIAKKAGVQRLVVTHHHPRRTDADLQAIAKQASELSGVEVILPEEGRAYEI